MTAAAPEESPVPPLPRKEAAEGILTTRSKCPNSEGRPSSLDAPTVPHWMTGCGIPERHAAAIVP